jgi:methionyl-tRNA formyltransferase
MTEQFDDGPILATSPVEVDASDTAMSLESKSKRALLGLFRSVVGKRAWETNPASCCPHPRAGRLHTADQFAALAQIDSLDDPLIDRRIRAFWNPPRSAAWIDVKGKRYSLCPSDQTALSAHD